MNSLPSLVRVSLLSTTLMAILSLAPTQGLAWPGEASLETRYDEKNQCVSIVYRDGNPSSNGCNDIPIQAKISADGRQLEILDRPLTPQEQKAKMHQMCAAVMLPTHVGDLCFPMAKLPENTPIEVVGFGLKGKKVTRISTVKIDD